MPHPSGEGYVQVHVDLWTRPLLSQVLECEPTRWELPDDDPCSLQFPLGALDYVAGDRGEGVTVHYRGREILQIYLVVLADCLHAANLGGQRPVTP